MKINLNKFKQNSRLKHLLLMALALIIVPASITAQILNITGSVKDTADGTPIIGASIVIKGTTNGTLTDVDGKFRISASPGSTLTFSYIGYKNQEVKVTDQTDINILLSVETKALDEVVITALGVKKEKSKLGYSVQDVKGDELVKARDANPVTGLTGKVAGLSVGASAEMLGMPTILMRGNTISLYVVDGVPISSDTWNISPDDIESFSILKGATAAALYGSRASNGAILITTKKATKDSRGVVVEFNSTNSFDNGFVAFPRQQFEYGGGENELYAFGDGKGAGLNDNDYDVWGPKFRGQLIPQWDGEYDPNTTYTTTFPGGLKWEGHIKPTPYIARGVNNLQNFLQTGIQTNDNLSITSTGENYTFRSSFSQEYQQGIVPNTKLNISNYNIYGSYNVTKHLKFEGNLNYNRQYTPNIPDVDYGPNSIIYNIAIWTGADWDINDPKIKAIWQPGKVGTQSIFAEYQRYHNPWFMSYDWLRGHYKTDVNGYTAVNYKFDDHLNVNFRTQISGYDLLRTEEMPFSAHPYGREQNFGDYREDRRNLFDNNTDLQINFDYTLLNFLNLSGLAGGNIRSFSYNSNFTTTDYLNVPGVYNFSNSRNPLQVNNFNSNMQVYSAYFSVDGTFGKYATLSITGREDKSTAILVQNAAYYYPSISIASVISKYVKLPDLISYLKIRASFASVRGVNTGDLIGSAPFNTITALGGTASNSILGYPLGYGQNYYSPYGGPTYSTSSVYSTSKPYNSKAAASYTDNLYDPNLKPSNRNNFEGGFDIQFLKNRLGFNATVFEYIDGPQILQNAISTSTGYSYDYINSLKYKWLGAELSLSGTPVKIANGLQWDVLVNWSTFKETYLELPTGQDVYNTFFHVGDRVDKLYATDFVRTKDGQIINDAAGKPIPNPVKQFLGNENGDFIWSFGNKFKYQQLSFSFQFDGNVGGVTEDLMHKKTMQGGNNIETVEGALGEARDADDQHAGDPNFKGIYVGEGVAVSNNVPINFDSKTGAITNYDQLQFSTNNTPTHVQDYVSKYYGIDKSNIMSKTYAKLREVTISYDLPSKWLSKTFISKASISLVGRNLLYIYGDKRFKDVDLDQYNGATSLTVIQTPTLRRYGFNINVTF
jgi:TonB-linked SusC/RagA family outer membrane protein